MDGIKDDIKDELSNLIDIKDELSNITNTIINLTAKIENKMKNEKEQNISYLITAISKHVINRGRIDILSRMNNKNMDYEDIVNIIDNLMEQRSEQFYSLKQQKVKYNTLEKHLYGIIDVFKQDISKKLETLDIILESENH